MDGIVIPSTVTLDGTKYTVTDVYSLSITPKYLKKTDSSIFGLIKFGSNVNKIGDMCKCGTAVENPVTVDLSDANISEIPNDCFNRACIKIILGSKVREIGKQAFYFSHIHGIKFKGTCNIEHIGESAFLRCYFRNVYSNDESDVLSAVKIDKNAFANTIGLTKFDFSRTKIIGDYAFCQSNITEVTTGAVLGKYAFSSCSLKNVKLLEGIKTIPAGCFYKRYYVYGNLFSEDTLSYSFEIIPKSVTRIGSSAFEKTKYITNKVKVYHNTVGEKYCQDNAIPYEVIDNAEENEIAKKSHAVQKKYTLLGANLNEVCKTALEQYINGEQTTVESKLDFTIDAPISDECMDMWGIELEAFTTRKDSQVFGLALQLMHKVSPQPYMTPIQDSVIKRKDIVCTLTNEVFKDGYGNKVYIIQQLNLLTLKVGKYVVALSGEKIRYISAYNNMLNFARYDVSDSTQAMIDAIYRTPCHDEAGNTIDRFSGTVDSLLNVGTKYNNQILGQECDRNEVVKLFRSLFDNSVQVDLGSDKRIICLVPSINKAIITSINSSSFGNRIGVVRNIDLVDGLTLIMDNCNIADKTSNRMYEELASLTDAQVNGLILKIKLGASADSWLKSFEEHAVRLSKSDKCIAVGDDADSMIQAMCTGNYLLEAKDQEWFKTATGDSNAKIKQHIKGNKYELRCYSVPTKLVTHIIFDDITTPEYWSARRDVIRGTFVYEVIDSNGRKAWFVGRYDYDDMLYIMMCMHLASYNGRNAKAVINVCRHINFSFNTYTNRIVAFSRANSQGYYIIIENVAYATKLAKTMSDMIRAVRTYEKSMALEIGKILRSDRVQSHELKVEYIDDVMLKFALALQSKFL